MKQFLAKRLVSSFVAIAGVSILVFMLIHFIPGDPVELLLGEAAHPQDKANYRKILGLHLPLHEQYLQFVKSLFSTWGYSFSRGTDVLPLIWSRFPATLLLALCGLSVGLFISVPLGVLSAIKRDAFWEKITSFLTLFGMSLPIFVIAPLMTLVFAIRLKWFPVAGFGHWTHIVLPSLVLGFSMSGILTRMVKTAYLEISKEDYLRTARAKGLSETRVIWIHGFRNALVPILTLVGNIFGGLLAGAVITETLFDWPGIGKLFFAAFQSRDYALIQGVVLWISMSYFLINLFVDLLYFVVDPRIQIERGEVS